LSDPDTAKSEPDCEAVRADYEDSILTLPAIYERHGIILAQVRVGEEAIWMAASQPPVAAAANRPHRSSVQDTQTEDQTHGN
jgi:hypothetical protein